MSEIREREVKSISGIPFLLIMLVLIGLWACTWSVFKSKPRCSKGARVGWLFWRALGLWYLGYDFGWPL